MKIDLLITNVKENETLVFRPSLKDDITLTTWRKSMPGQLAFSVFADDTLDIEEGNTVTLKVDGTDLFMGYIFSRKYTSDGFFDIVAFDQLRYLKNRDVYQYTNMRASEVLKMICEDHKLVCGEIEQTEYIIPRRLEHDRAIWDIINTALQLELENKGNSYILYDDYGKITLKNTKNMLVDILICEKTAQSVGYSVSIDNAYNTIKTYSKDSAGCVDKEYVSADEGNVKKWGKLQHCEKLESGENGQVKAYALLKHYNSPTESMQVQDCFGDIRVRAGSRLCAQFSIGKKKYKNWMRVDFCVHKFSAGEHTMTLDLTKEEEYNEIKVIESENVLSPAVEIAPLPEGAEETKGQLDLVVSYETPLERNVVDFAEYYRHPHYYPNNKLGDFTNENDKKISIYGVYAYNGEYWVHAHYDWNGRNEKESPMVYFPKKHVYLDNTWDPKWGEWLYVFREPKMARHIKNGTMYYKGGGKHTGMDIFSDVNGGIANNYPVYSATFGKVIFAGLGRPENGETNYGNAVVIKTGNPDNLKEGYYLRYAHFADNTISVKEGDKVTPFTMLGVVGKTGLADAHHLHFEVRASDIGNKWGTVYNPLYFFNHLNIIFTKVQTSTTDDGEIIPVYGDCNEFSESIVWRKQLNENVSMVDQL